MYPHKKFTTEDDKMIRSFVELFPLANVLLIDHEEIQSSYLPLIYQGHYLLGHIDLNNPMMELLQDCKAVKLIFNGPENYISPGHFNTPEFPTYNYMKVEIDAEASLISRDELRESIYSMTNLLDHKYPNNLAGKEAQMEMTMNYISGFKLKILKQRARFKMSQDKTKSHFLKAIEVLKLEEQKRKLKMLELLIEFEIKKIN